MSAMNDFMRAAMTELPAEGLSVFVEKAGVENTRRAEELLREEFAHLPEPLPPLTVPKEYSYPAHKFDRKEKRKLERENKKKGLKTKFY